MEQKQRHTENTLCREKKRLARVAGENGNQMHLQVKQRQGVAESPEWQ